MIEKIINKTRVISIVLVLLCTFVGGMRREIKTNMYDAILGPFAYDVNFQPTILRDLSVELLDTYRIFIKKSGNSDAFDNTRWLISDEIKHKLKDDAKEYTTYIGKTKIAIVQGDITKQTGVKAIVNAAQASLSHGAGVALAISRAAGPQLQQICNTMHCDVGDVVITDAYDLQKIGIKKIIHAVGPNCKITEQKAIFPALIQNVYNKTLELAVSKAIRTIAFPAISINIFGCDEDLCTAIAMGKVKEFVKTHPEAFDEIRFVIYGVNKEATRRIFNLYVRYLLEVDI